MAKNTLRNVSKVPTGMLGFDEITQGGIPKGRTTLICGGPGCGKTLFAMRFLINGAVQFDQPGLFVSFEENADDLEQNIASFGYDLAALKKQKKLTIEYVEVHRNEIIETGEYDLEGLFIRLGHAIATTGAKRVVLDTIETLFSGFTNEGVLRAELLRLFHWLKEKGVTTIITGEKGEKMLTRHGLEEYVSDCVIFLDHRVINQLSTRRLRIIKYRGSAHGTNEYPFLIDETGISVMPITSVGLDYQVSNIRVSSGVKELDSMFDGKGYYKGSTVLISGTAGTGKTSIASLFVDAACKRGERCLYFAFEESASQIIRNMKSIGITFDDYVRKGLLHFRTVRPTVYGLEMHLVMMHKAIMDFKPDIVVIDPISNLISQGNVEEVKGMLMRIIDTLRQKNVTTFLTNLTSKNIDFETVEVNVSSIADTWLAIRDIEINGELKRGIMIVKSRGMSHSNKIKEFVITDKGIKITNS